MTKIKICGLRREEDIAYVNEYRPDYVGFVFADSRRRVTKEQAKALRELLLPEIIPVGVFVNEEISKIAEIVQEGIIDVVQLHGIETEDYIRQLRMAVGDIPLIKAVRVAGEEDVKGLEEIKADYLLFDSFSVKEYGGTGKVFDWELVKNINRPFFLAGGINCDNVKDALSLGNVYAVDVSSAVETDGYKDREKIKEMVGLVRGNASLKMNKK